MKKLSIEQKASYDNLQSEHIAKRYGEPLDVATTIFKDYQTKQFNVKRVKNNYVGQRVMFTKKLEVMNDEFDTYIGALVADLMFKQHL